MENASRLRVLIIEDDENDKILIEREFNRNGYPADFFRAENEKKLLQILDDGPWDVVLSDHNLSGLTSFEALGLVRRSGCSSPFIVVSGSIGEETAVELLQCGAYDCIMKDNLARLVPAVKKALDAARVQKERNDAERELYESHRALEDALLRLKENQFQLVQTEKMASLGQLAAGIAHEINNPLGYVIGNLSMLQHYVALIVSILDLYERLGDNLPGERSAAIEAILSEIGAVKARDKFAYVREDLGHLLQETREGADCIKDLTQRLKIFAHPDRDKWQLFNVNESVETALKLTWNELKYKCKVRRDLREVPLISCHPGRLSQVFMNLLVNASHAIAEHGEVAVSSGTENRDVFVKIADSGEGIEEENLEKIFTPFFTTKPSGLGTGLGLSISHGIIKEHNGSIEVESRKGKGTTFTIRLPHV